MIKPMQLLTQGVVYALLAVAVGYFSANPAYTHTDPNKAVIKLSFSHAAQRKEPCRRFSPEEIAQMAPNMRRLMDCPRERLPLFVELVLDGNMLFRESLPPKGIARDGAGTIYRRFTVAAGQHVLTARLRDSARTTGFDYEKTAQVELLPQQNFVVDFRAVMGGFVFI